jgi:hypothetical protein
MILWCVGLSFLAFATESISTGSLELQSPPSWVSPNRVERVTERVQNTLEWQTRRVKVLFYADEARFRKAHGLSGDILGFTREREQIIHLGPAVQSSNFDEVLGHELAHIILFQKYKGAIPPWMVEGLANKAAGRKPVDYAWLARQKLPPVRTLRHPFRDASSRLHYQLSTAAVEMLQRKCDFPDLLQMSLKGGVEPRIASLCGITDLDRAVREWVSARALVPQAIKT